MTKFKRWFSVVLWCGLIFIGSSLPSAQVSSNWLVDFVAHKLIHLVEYGVLFVLLHRALRISCPKISVLGLLGLSLGLAVAYGVLDEYHQTFLPGRQGRWQDVVVDGIGALGAAVVGYFRTSRKRSAD
ncbi:VanZ family protein [Candidatus Parcubacteria bacterium]|nr:VanZ family protein [Candidatus Parcubacteria bacterium]